MTAHLLLAILLSLTILLVFEVVTCSDADGFYAGPGDTTLEDGDNRDRL